MSTFWIYLYIYLYSSSSCCETNLYTFNFSWSYCGMNFCTSIVDHQWKLHQYSTDYLYTKHTNNNRITIYCYYCKWSTYYNAYTYRSIYLEYDRKQQCMIISMYCTNYRKPTTTKSQLYIDLESKSCVCQSDSGSNMECYRRYFCMNLYQCQSTYCMMATLGKY